MDEQDAVLDKIGAVLDGHDLNDVMPVLAFLIVRVAIDSGNGREHFFQYMNKIADTLFDKTPINLQ
jgi:hypothetical protein